MIIAITKEGIIKRTPKSEYNVQKMGQKGVLKKYYSEGILTIAEASIEDFLLLFTQQGKCYRIKVIDIPSTTFSEKGLSLKDLFSIKDDTFCSILPIQSYYSDEELNSFFVLIMTKYWKIVRQKLQDYLEAPNGVIAITLNENDQVASVALSKDENFVFNSNVYARGKIFDVNDIPLHSLKSKAKGVLCGNGSYLTNLNKNNLSHKTLPIGLDTSKEVKTSAIIVTNFGYIGRMYSFQCGRANFGPCLLTLRENDFVVFSAFAIDTEDILIVTTQGYILRLNIAEIKICQREIKGKVGIKLLEHDNIVACCKISAPKNTTMTHEISKWDDYQLIQKQKLQQFIKQRLLAEAEFLVKETIETLEREGICSEYWKYLYKLETNNLNTNELLSEDESEFSNNYSTSNKVSIELPLQSEHSKKIVHEEIEVPQWANTYIYSIRDLYTGTTSQQQFYRYFKEQFLKGNYIDIKGNANYAFLLMYDLYDTYNEEPFLLKEYFQSLIEICPLVEHYAKNQLKGIFIDTKRQQLKRQLLELSIKQRKTCKWIEKGKEIEINGVKLCRGGFYIGDCFKLPQRIIKWNKYHYDCSYIYGPAINPVLPINNKAIEDEYFCSYQDMTPSQRSEYLKWLSGVYPIEDTCIDYILYYLYGLEIRLFIDNTDSLERQEVLSILLELYKELNNLDKNKYSEYHQLAYTLKQIINVAIVKYYPSSASEYLSEDELAICHEYSVYIVNQELDGKSKLTSEDAYSIAKKTYLLRDLPIRLYENDIKERFISLFKKRFKKNPAIQRDEYCTENIRGIRMNCGGGVVLPRRC